ncbi:MAG: transmembrane prediction, partial [Opitutaceae bacterium]
MAALLAGSVVFAQRFGGGQIYVEPGARTAREIGTRSVGTPEWDYPREFRADVFTFARLRYDTAPRPSSAGRGGWATDLPDADLNLSWRLQQLTALKVDPDCRLVRATDE